MREELGQQSGNENTDSTELNLGDDTSLQFSAQVAGGMAQTIPAGPANIVTLPSDAVIDQVLSDGRDLVIILADGSRITVPDGAIILPQLVVGDTPIPPANLAALLVGNEPEPAAGAPQSSGGNFAGDPGDIQAAFDIGDLLPYTELARVIEPDEEILPFSDEEPDISIEPDNSGVSVINAQDAVDEEGLPARGEEPEGSNSAADSEATFGFINFTSPDGTSSITINGVAITTVGQTISTDLGTMTITSIADGRIGYDYVLADNTTDAASADNFTVVITDVDGDQATATLRIDIIDDMPAALDDTNVVPGGSHEPVSGNVADNDISGADGFPVDGAVTGFSNGGGSAQPGETLQGEYGVVTINADGTYTYARDFNTPGGVEDSFDYAIVDQDGSTATATLTITIEDAPSVITSIPETGDGTIVNEGGLPPRTDEPAGTGEIADSDADNDSDPSEATSGTITFNSPDGVESVTINGTPITPGSLPQTIVNDGTGMLVITDYTYDPVTGEGTISYKYTLGDNTSGDDTNVSFEVVVTDLDGDEASDDLVITIIDDTPIAADDSGAQASENAAVTVDAFANDTAGADGVDFADIAVVDGTLSGSGTVTYNGDGTFTYTPAAGEEGEVSFDYSITDGDGDISAATVTITLLGDSTPTIDVLGDNDVDEAGLPARGDEPAGSNAATDGEIANGTIPVTTGNDTLASLVINGTNVTGGGVVTTAKGVLTVTESGGNYSYSYVLTDNTLSDPDSDSFSLTVTDSDGDTASTTLVIAIVDDFAAAEDDANSIDAGLYGPVGGNVLDNDTRGADGASVTSYSGTGGSGTTGQVVQGTYGTLTIAADGTYSYTRDPGTDGGVTDTFTYTITDGDTDTATADLVITIADAPTSLDLPTGEDGTLVDESGLAGPPEGTNAAGDGEFTSGVFTYTAPDGPAVVTIDGVAVTAAGQTFTGDFGTITIDSITDGSISYTYQLTTNTYGDTTFDSFDVVVTDQDGDFSAGTLQIDIVDDFPTATDVTATPVLDDDAQAGGNAGGTGDVANNTVATGAAGALFVAGADGVQSLAITGPVMSVIHIGADGIPQTKSVTWTAVSNPDGSVTLTGSSASIAQAAVLVVNADGSYSYTQLAPVVNPLVGTTEETTSFEFAVTVTDGDTDTATSTLTVNVNDDTPTATAEAGGDVTEGASVTGTLDFAAGADGATVTAVDGQALVFGADGYSQTIDIGNGSIKVKATGEYSFTADGPLANPAIADATFTVTDGDGDTASADISFTIVDGNAPTGGTAYALVDDDGLPLGNPASTIGDATPDSDPDGNEATYSGTLDFTPGGDTPVTITFDAALDGSTVVLGTEVLTYSVVGNLLTATGPRGIVFKVVITDAEAGTYLVMLKDNVLHEGGPNEEAADAIASIGFVITDSDNSTASTTLTITFNDDAPTANDDDARSVVEGGGVIGGNVIAPYAVDDADASGADFAGGDGGLLTHVDIGSGFVALTSGTDLGGGFYQFSNAAGIYAFTAGGEWTFAPNGGLSGPTDATFSYRLTDSDGDTAEATQPINVEDGVGPQVAGAVTLTVDEAGLDATGSTPAATTETDQSGAGNQLTFTAGSDAITSVVFADPAVVVPAIDLGLDDGVTVVWTLSNAGRTLTGSIGGDDVIVLQLTGSQSASANGGTVVPVVTATLTDAFPHQDVADADTLAISNIGVTASEADLDAVTGYVTVNVTDDEPAANDDDAQSVVEGGAAIDGNVITPDAADDADASGADVAGADGAALTHVDIGSGFVALTSGTDLGGGVYQFSNAAGVYTFNAGGDWTFTPASDLANPADASFDYRLTDGDGDTAEATQPITVTDGAGPQVAGAVTLTVDEAGLDASGSTPAATTETAQSGAGNQLTFTAGSDAITSVVFADPAVVVPAIDLGLDDGVTVVWALSNAGRTLTGSIGGDDVIVLQLTGSQSASANGGTVVPVVTATLTDAFPHQDVADADTLAISNIGVTASEADLDAVTGYVTVNVTDDEPAANDDDAQSVVEGGAAIDGNVITPDAADDADASGADVAGADGASLTHVDIGSGFVALTSGTDLGGGVYQFSNAAGVYTFNAGGDWTFTPASDLANPADASFDYRLTDGDGDTAEATQPITVTDGAGPQVAGAVTLTVDEAGLDATGSTPAATTETAQSGAGNQLTFTAGSDAITSVVFADPAVVVPAIDLGLDDGVTVVWTLSNAGRTLTGSIGGDDVIVLQLTGSQSASANGGTVVPVVTATLTDAFPHQDVADADTLAISNIGVTASEADLDAVTGYVTVNVTDDEPVNFTPVDLTDTSAATGTFQDDALANDGTATATRLLNDPDNDGVGTDFIGGDSFGSLDFVGGTDGDILQVSGANATSGGDVIYLFGFGTDTLTATTDPANANSGAVVFQVSLDTGAGEGENATYTIEFFAKIDDGSGFTFDDFSSAPAGQNKWIGLDADGGNINQSQNDSEDLLITALNGGTVNTSSSDIGSNNQWIDENEGIRLDYVTDVSGGGSEGTVQGYNFDAHYSVTNTSFSILQVKGGSGNAVVTVELLQDADTGNIKTLTGSTVNVDIGSIVVTTSGGVDITGSVSITDNGDGTVTIGGLNAGDNVFLEGVSTFNSTEISHGGGSDFALGNFGFQSAVSGNDVPLSFDVQATDADGDTSTGTIDVTLTASTTPPIALDLDGDGVEFVGLEAGVLFDYGQGEVATAWVNADDGILARNTGTGYDVVFADDAQGAHTDLQGLAMAYDTNGDAVLSASDAAWGQFGVLKGGEFISLADIGISAINLSSDGAGYRTAGGDVLVYGTGEYVRADGSSGQFADAAFATAPADRQAQRSNENALATAAMAGFLAASVTDSAALAVPGIAQDVSANGANAFALAFQPETLVRTAEDAPIELIKLDASDEAYSDAAGVPDSASFVSEDGAASTFATLQAEDLAAFDWAAEDSGAQVDAPAFDFSALAVSDSAMMEALLLASASNDDGEAAGGQAQPDVENVMTDALAANDVDAVIDMHVDHAGAGEAAVSADGAQSNFASYLYSNVGGDSGHVVFVSMQDTNDDASIAAVAQA